MPWTEGACEGCGKQTRDGVDATYLCHDCKVKRGYAETPLKYQDTPQGRLAYYMEEKTQRMLEISRAKNADYTGASDDPFANFTRVESLGICSPEIGFLTRMTDKLCRIASFAKKGELQVKDESVEDTLLDLANYCLLLGAYLAEMRFVSKGGACTPTHCVCFLGRCREKESSGVQP